MECPYASQERGRVLMVRCLLNKGKCQYIRYCMSERTYKNTSDFMNCPYKQAQLEKQ